MIRLIPWLILLPYVPALGSAYNLPKFICVSIAAGILLARREPRGSVLTLPILFGLASVLLSSLASSYPTISILGRYFDHSTGFLPWAMLGVLALLVRKEDREELLSGTVDCAAINGVVCVLQYLINDHLPYLVAPFPLYHGRAYGTLGSPIYTAALLAMMAPPSIMLKRWAALFFVLAGLLATQSRAGIIAAIVAVLWQYLPIRKLIVPATVCFLIATVALFGRGDRLKSDSGRLHIWGMAVEAGIENPILGHGPATFGYIVHNKRNAKTDAIYGKNGQGHAHNWFLEAWATMGLVGILCIAHIIYVVCTHTVHTSPIIALFVCGLFNPMSLGTQAIGAMLLGANAPESSVKMPRQLAMLLVAASLICGGYYVVRSVTMWQCSTGECRTEALEAAEDLGLIWRTRP